MGRWQWISVSNICVLFLWTLKWNVSNSQFLTKYTHCQGQISSLYCQPSMDSLAKRGIRIKSMTFVGVLGMDEDSLPEVAEGQCFPSANQTQCSRTADGEGSGLETALKYVFDFVLASCEYKEECEYTVPTWYVAKGPMGVACQQKTAYLLRLFLDVECVDIQNDTVVTREFPPTTPDWHTTTQSEEYIKSLLAIPLIREKPLSSAEQIILAVAIGVGVLVLFIVLFVFLCYDIYRRKRNEAKHHRHEAGPKRQKNWFDTVKMFAMGTAWKDVDGEALGEHTGFKPDEYVEMDRTLDRSHTSAATLFGGDLQNYTLPRAAREPRAGGDDSTTEFRSDYSRGNETLHEHALGDQEVEDDSGFGFSTLPAPVPRPAKRSTSKLHDKSVEQARMNMLSESAKKNGRNDFSALPAPPTAAAMAMSRSGSRLSIGSNLPYSEAMEY